MLLPCRSSAITMASSSYHSTTRRSHAPWTFVVHGDCSSRYHHRAQGGWNRHRAIRRDSSSPPRRHHHYRQGRGLAAARSRRSCDGNAMTRFPGGGGRYDDAIDVTRRWRSDGDVDLRGGGMKNDATNTSVKIGERRREDHAHCVGIVRTRDYEGYRECDKD